VNDEIFQIPPIGFEVKLDGIENFPHMILQNSFDLLMEMIRQTKPIFKVVMDSKNTLLANRINKLKKLRWEDYYDLGNIDDNSIIEKYRLDHFDMNHDIFSPRLPVGTDVKVRIVIIERCGKDLLPTIGFEPLIPHIIDMKKAFINQINHYMNKVEASNFYPAIKEMAFIKPPEGQPKSGQWLRCVCIELMTGRYALYKCIDSNDTVKTEGKTDHIFRRVIPELMLTPRFLVFGILSGPDHTNFMSECFNRTFKIGKEVIIKILPKVSDDPKSIDKCVYECSEFATRMRELRKEWDFRSDKPLDSNFVHAPNSYSS